MAPDSKTEIGAPPSFGARSTIAGMRLFGAIAQKFRLELIALADVHRMNLIRQAGLFEKHRDLMAVGRRPIIKLDHPRLLARAVAQRPALFSASDRKWDHGHASHCGEAQAWGRGIIFGIALVLRDGSFGPSSA